MKKAYGSKLTPFLTASVSWVKRKWKLGLQILSMAFLIMAWARPQSGQSKHEIRAEGVEIVLVADVSESMLADDVRPSRLEQAKVDLGKLTDLLSGNKIGLIAFAGSAALLSPLTTDPGSLKLFINSLTINSVSSQGTNFKGALGEAKGAFERGGNGEAPIQSGVNRVIVVLSDGEDHEPGAQEAAQKLADEGTHIFTIAYGTEKGAPIPERDSLGYLKGYKKDRKGQTVLTTVNGNELRDLAQAGHGVFYFASPGTDYLNQLVGQINKIEKSKFDTEMSVQFDEKFQYFLVVSLILGALSLFIGDRRAAFRLWKGRFEVPAG